MINIDISIAIYSDFLKAKQAVQMLTESGMPIKALSIVGREMYLPENFLEFSGSPTCIGEWGERSVCVAGTAVLGNFGAFVIAACETLAGAPISGAVDVAFSQLGIPEDRAKFYQDQMHAGCFLLIVRTACNRGDELDVTLQATNMSTFDSPKTRNSEWNSTVRLAPGIASPEFRRTIRPVIHVAHR